MLTLLTFLSGRLLKTWMSDYTRDNCQFPLMRPPSIARSPWNPLIVSRLWHSPLLYPTLEIG